MASTAAIDWSETTSAWNPELGYTFSDLPPPDAAIEPHPPRPPPLEDPNAGNEFFAGLDSQDWDWQGS